jgi:hypothetical protein
MLLNGFLGTLLTSVDGVGGAMVAVVLTVVDMMKKWDIPARFVRVSCLSRVFLANISVAFPAFANVLHQNR